MNKTREKQTSKNNYSSISNVFRVTLDCVLWYCIFCRRWVFFSAKLWKKGSFLIHVSLLLWVLFYLCETCWTIRVENDLCANFVSLLKRRLTDPTFDLMSCLPNRNTTILTDTSSFYYPPIRSYYEYDESKTINAKITIDNLYCIHDWSIATIFQMVGWFNSIHFESTHLSF